MTLKQTRQLAVEFERRVQTIFPATELQEKLDTETIYSFLNEYQFMYVHKIYNNLDKLDSNAAKDAEHVLRSMLRTAALVKSTDSDNTLHLCDTYRMPIDYRMYIRSVSNISKTSSSTGDSVVPNELIQQNSIDRLIETPYNQLRILRRPLAVLSKTSEEDISFQQLYQDTSDEKRSYVEMSTDVAENLLNNCLSEKYYRFYLDDVYANNLVIDMVGVIELAGGRELQHLHNNIFNVDFNTASKKETMEQYEAAIDYYSKINHYTRVYLRVKFYDKAGDVILFNNIIVSNIDGVSTANKPTLSIIHDRYTTINGVTLVYYKEPLYFDIMTSTACELPVYCFEELVNGAVQLYSDYVRGGIRRQEEEGRRDRFDRRQQQKEQEQEQNQ